MDLQSPPSVPLDKLSALLGKSMAIMKKAEQLKPTRINESVNDYQEEEINEAYTQSVPAVSYAQTVNNSKLPDAIKKLMLDKPITQPNTGVSESYYNESDEKEMPATVRRQAPQQKMLVKESATQQSGSITISEAKLEEMINRQLLNFFKTNYDKALTEQAINKTIKTLINEGVLTSKKKI